MAVVGEAELNREPSQVSFPLTKVVQRKCKSKPQ
jgi:hypothetical protein